MEKTGLAEILLLDYLPWHNDLIFCQSLIKQILAYFLIQQMYGVLIIAIQLMIQIR